MTLALLALLAAAGARVEITFDALERMVASQAFDGEGRRYVRGGKETRCNFGYLEKPSIRGKDGRLAIRARFTGRSALDMFGRCIGLGDAFDVLIVADPQYKDGALVLQNVRVTSESKNGFYVRKVCSSMQWSLEREFKYVLSGEARRILEDPGPQPQFKRELRNFNVTAITVAADAVVLHVDLQLRIQ